MINEIKINKKTLFNFAMLFIFVLIVGLDSASFAKKVKSHELIRINNNMYQCFSASELQEYYQDGTIEDGNMINFIRSIFKKKNIGHRLGGDLFPPENSIESMENVQHLQYEDDFYYWEKDVTESKDGVPYTNHDATERKTIKRLYDVAKGYEYLLKKSFYEIDSHYIKNFLRLKNGERVSTTNVMLGKLVKIAEVPIRLDIKRLNKRIAKKALVKVIKLHRKKDGQPISLMMKRKKFNKMKDREYFKELCEKNNIELKIY